MLSLSQLESLLYCKPLKMMLVSFYYPIIRLIVIMYKMKKSNPNEKRKSNRDDGALLKDNPLFGVNDDSNY